jgi:hypothetical protein
VLVEVKLTTNRNLLHGFEKQIEEYQKAEQTVFAVYLVIDVEGGSYTKIAELEQLVAQGQDEGKRMPEVIYVYARRRPSASRYRVNKRLSQ